MSGRVCTRAQVAERLRGRLALSRAQAGTLLDQFIELITEELEAGGRVSLRGLGSLELSLSSARLRRNPATGRLFAVGRRPVFRLSRVLRERMKEKARATDGS